MSFIQDVEERLKIFKVNKQKLQSRTTLRKATRKTKKRLYEKSTIIDNPKEEEKEAISAVNLKLVNDYDPSALLPRQKGTRDLFKEQ